MKAEDISIDELLACAKRELSYRRRVYPRLLEMDRMTPEKAEYEIACMERIIEILDQITGRLL